MVSIPMLGELKRLEKFLNDKDNASCLFNVSELNDLMMQNRLYSGSHAIIFKI